MNEFAFGGASFTDQIRNQALADEAAKKKKSQDDYFSYLSALGQMEPEQESPFLSPLASNVGKGQFADPEMNVAYEAPSEDYYQKVTKLASMTPDQLKAESMQKAPSLNYNKLASMGAGVGSSKLDKLQEDYYKRAQEALDMDKADIEALRAKKAELEAQGNQTNALPYLLALGSDFFSKDQNLAANFDPAAKEKVRQAKISDLEDQIRKGRGSYTQGELSLLKTQLDYEKEKLENARKSAKDKEDSNKPKEYKDFQYQSAVYGKRMSDANAAIENLLAASPERFTSTSAGFERSLLPSSMESDDIRQMSQAERNFVNAVLRKESGSAISKEEFKNAEQQYFPRAGDDEQTLALKAQNRARVIEGMKVGAGGAWNEFSGTAAPPSGSQSGSIKEWQGKTYQLQGNQWVRIK